MGFLRELDLFDKFMNSDYATSTFGGRMFSAMFYIFGIFFITAEMISYSRPLVFRDLLYSPRLEAQNKVNFTIKIQVDQPCYFLHFDIIDNLGLKILNENKNVVFKRMSQSNQFIAVSNSSVQDICFSCYDLIPDKNCCFCEDIVNFMRKNNIDINSNIMRYEQCSDEFKFDVDDTETCLIEANVPIFRTTGEIHIGTGINKEGHGSKHVHDLYFGMRDRLAHSIYDFYINERRNNTISPLKGKIFRTKRATVFTYNIKVTKVVHTHNGEFVDQTYEYSLNEGHVNFHGPALSNNPGIYVTYQFSPFTVVERTVTKNPMKLAVSAAGVLAGAFAVVTAMNGLLSKFCPVDGPKTPVAFK
jgi:hypothetical protein